MKGKKNLFQVQANPNGWSSQSSDSEDDHMKHRNVSSDEEDLQKAVQDLGLVVLDCTPSESRQRQLPRTQTRKSRSKSLSNMTKRAFISIFPSKKDKSKQQPKRCTVTLDDFPDVPTHEIFL